ncbi:MAG: DUF1292 domain-containing protein [Bacilli bacterium]|nr:DUF1292 domain-containing protein [Bacilli bacterium]
MDNKFNVIDENGIEKEAEIITSFNYNEKDYLIYSIDSDEENTNIFVSKLLKDSEGYDYIEDINDDKEREEIQSIVKEILKTVE